jgi:copper chaperone NosL
MKWLMTSLAIILLLTVYAGADEQRALKPSSKDKCPVCGMFVAKYPDWVAEIIFKDGSAVYFDGCKDMFKYYLDVEAHDPKKNRNQIDSIYVTEYYSLKFMDGTQAFFVTGSDIFGPMGKELMPFEKEADAREFLKDHKGEKIIKFKDIGPEIMNLFQ